MCWKFWKKAHRPLPKKSLAEIKNACNVLFIDNEKFKTVDRLKLRDGWRNTFWIRDVESYDQPEIINAHVIFIDIQGVGKKLCPKDEGLGLIAAIKERYPEKKVVMYSAEKQGKIDGLHKAADMVDGRLRKLADHYEYQKILERMASETFSLESYTLRIQKILYNEFAIKMSVEEIENNIVKVVSSKDQNKAIGEYFNISNVASIAQLIFQFMSINAA